MTIIHINIGLGGGGAEHMILELAKKGNENDLKNIVISLSNINNIKYKFEKEQITVHSLNINSFLNLKNDLKNFHEIVKTYKDIVFHCHMFHGLMFGAAYSLIYKNTPIVFTLHNTIVNQLYRRHLLYLTKPIRKFDINFSRKGQKWYLKPIVIIPNGIDFNKFKCLKKRSYTEDKKFIFLFLGRIQKQKNPLSLINFTSKLLKSGKNNFEIHVAGEGNLKKELEVLINKNSYNNYIKLLGFQNNINNLLNSVHCLIMPSLWEGLPVTLIEASITHLPIITTPVGSIPEFFNDTNCFISNLDNFHLAMKEVMENYEIALNKAQILYQSNKSKFDINEVYKRHLKLYKMCLNS